MQKVLDQRITTKLSLAVLLIDDFTKREEIVGEPDVSIPTLKLKAIKNPGGYCNFLDLPDGTHTLEVKSDYYLGEKVDISLPLYTIRNPLRFDHVSGTALRKLIPSPDTRAQIADTESSAGDVSIYLTNITGSIQSGDIYVIMDEQSSLTEFCEIDVPIPADPGVEPFFLTLPLRFGHSKGTVLKRIVPGLAIAEINGVSSGVKAGDLEVSLKNIIDAVNIKDIFTVEDSDFSKIEFSQIMAPMTKVVLRPKHRYPFPSGTTLIRGEVKDSTRNPISGASIKLTADSSKTRTSSNGEFVLHFPASREDGLVQMDVTPPGAILPKTVTGEIRKGRATFLPVIYL